MDGKANQAVDDKPYIDERKPSSTMAAKGDLNNGPSPKKMDGKGFLSSIMNHSSMRGSHQARRL
jgi:hypothetical protein